MVKAFDEMHLVKIALIFTKESPPTVRPKNVKWNELNEKVMKEKYKERLEMKDPKSNEMKWKTENKDEKSFAILFLWILFVLLFLWLEQNNWLKFDPECDWLSFQSFVYQIVCLKTNQLKVRKNHNQNHSLCQSQNQSQSLCQSVSLNF